MPTLHSGMIMKASWPKANRSGVFHLLLSLHVVPRRRHLHKQTEVRIKKHYLGFDSPGPTITSLEEDQRFYRFYS